MKNGGGDNENIYMEYWLISSLIDFQNIWKAALLLKEWPNCFYV